jgi:hypothetical protein
VAVRLRSEIGLETVVTIFSITFFREARARPLPHELTPDSRPKNILCLSISGNE